jgi:predicted nucleic acid-binding protein
VTDPEGGRTVRPLPESRFLYAAGGPHPEREACVGVLQRISEGLLDATVNTEVVQELLFVLARRGRRQDGLKLARSVLSLFPGLLPVRGEDMLRACDLVERYPRLPVKGCDPCGHHAQQRASNFGERRF